MAAHVAEVKAVVRQGQPFIPERLDRRHNVPRSALIMSSWLEQNYISNQNLRRGLQQTPGRIWAS